MRTWVAELATVAIVLSGTALATHGAWTSWISVVAVTLSFAHGQVSDRLAEREASRAKPAVDCHRMALFYFVAKELAWCAFFVSTRAYPALVGVALFLLYPVWRRAWRARHPLANGAT